MSEKYITFNNIKNLLKEKIDNGIEVFGPVLKDNSPYISKLTCES